MKKLLLSILTVASITAMASVPSAVAPVSTIPVGVESQIKAMFPKTTIKAINSSPYPGMYSVIAGKNAFYIEAGNESQVMVGHILNMKTMQDETQNLINAETTSVVKFSDLPLNSALKVGKGKQELAVFIDPDCPYCQRLEEWIDKHQDKLTVYYFFTPLAMHPNALPHSIQILCASNPAQALNQIMVKQQALGEPSSECQTKVQGIITNNYQLAQKLSVDGTPFVIMSDNTTINGFNQPALEKFIGVTK